MIARTQHSPGPWLLSWNGRVKRAIFAKGHSSPLAELRASSSISSLEADANALLIVAAPDLLKSLQDELTVLDAEARTWAGFPATDPAYIALENRRDKIRAVIANASAA